MLMCVVLDLVTLLVCFLSVYCFSDCATVTHITVYTTHIKFTCRRVEFLVFGIGTMTEFSQSGMKLLVSHTLWYMRSTYMIVD